MRLLYKKFQQKKKYLNKISNHFNTIAAQYDEKILAIKNELKEKVEKTKLEILRNKTEEIQACADSAAKKEDLKNLNEQLEKLQNFKNNMNDLNEKRLSLIDEIALVEIEVEKLENMRKGA